jgi:outer membrane protein assembly factor BamB
VRTELGRIDAASVRITATRQLGAVYFDQAVAAGGSLWVATSSLSGEALVRLDPQTLAVTGRRWVGGGGNQGFSGHVLAAAGGGLWVAGGDRLLRLSLPAGAVTASVPLPGAAASQVAADSSGTVLVAEETTSIGSGILQRRDPATGALLAASPAVPGVAGLFLGGVIGSGVWVSNATGMMGYAERFDAETLTPGPGTRVEGTNGITVQVADGLAWVSPGAGWPGPGFCADPSSGRVLAPVKLPQADRLLAIGPGQLFYAAPAPDGSEYVEREPLPGGCRAG